MQKWVKAAIVAAFWCVGLTSANADELVLSADRGDPIVEARINGETAKLLIDLRLPDIMVINPSAQARLKLRLIPGVGGRAVLDDAAVKARIARPKTVFANGRSIRALTGLFGAPWAPDLSVDGAIGPGGLPYDRVRIVLREGAGQTTHRFTLADTENWTIDAQLLGEPAQMGFSLRDDVNGLNRAASRFLEQCEALIATGAVQRTDFFLGLSTTTQPVRVNATIGGMRIRTAVARTEAPLAGSDDVGVITVVADPKNPPRRLVTLGRETLSACYDIVWERRAKTLSVRCN
jgi:hypothetical protein